MGKAYTAGVAEDIFNQLGYLNEETNTYYETFNDYIQALPSWDEFISMKEWNYATVNHLFKQAGFHGQLSPDMFSVPLPKEAYPGSHEVPSYSLGSWNESCFPCEGCWKLRETCIPCQ